jgi:hypothetical protein
MMSSRRNVLSALVVLLFAAQLVQAQEQLASARALYASAEYDQALEVLSRLSDVNSSDHERQQIELYRTLCLFAVGRRADADRSIESIITRDPLYQPGSDVPPRARTAFSDAKKRLLPAIVQQQYAEAKTAFERSEFQSAAAAFRRVISALDDPDIGVAGRQPPLADLRTLAAGFHDLSVKSIPPPLPPAPPVPAVVAAIESPVASSPRIFTGEETGLRPPVAISQDLPKYPGMVPAAGLKGVVEVVIDKAGHVQSASIVTPLQGSIEPGRFVVVQSSYHTMVLAAASRWRFEPATMNGVPVPFRKRVQIQVAPPTR